MNGAAAVSNSAGAMSGTKVLSKNGGRVMLMGGQDFPTARRVWWNFVSSRQDRIDQAVMDWTEGRFPTVENDPEFIPLPETPLTNSDPI